MQSSWHYWKFPIRRVSGSSPRAKTWALGKVRDAKRDTRQKEHLGKHMTLPRVGLGKGTICREPSSSAWQRSATWHIWRWLMARPRFDIFTERNSRKTNGCLFGSTSPTSLHCSIVQQFN